MQNIEKIVTEIIENVQNNGNKALIEYSKKFDNVDLTEKDLFIDVKKFENALEKIPVDILKALENAKNNIEDYHKSQYSYITKSPLKIVKNGLSISEKISSIEKVGVYVPGGRYSYPSTVFMTVIPAKCAGVKEIIVATPMKNLTDVVKSAIFLSGADKVLCVGGAQAISALTFGTETVKKVDMIVGPGNAFVTEAKRQVFGKVGIDMLAGPSDVLIFADNTSNLEFIAMDLMAQAEHDLMSKAILVVEEKNKYILDEIKNKINPEFLNQIEFYCKETINDVAEFINEKAPEHLEICIDDTNKINDVLNNINNAGAIFVGNNTCVAMGDYFIGPSHTLPTNFNAKFSSGLSVNTFLKRAAVMKVEKDWIKENSEFIENIANSEGLKFHAKSIKIRK